MTSETIASIKEQADLCEEELRKVEKILSGLAEGKLYIQRRKNGKKYYRRCVRNKDGGRSIEYLSLKDTSLIRQLAEREYLYKYIPALKKELDTLRTFTDNYSSEDKTRVWQQLSPDIRELTAARCETTEEADLAWRNEEYEASYNYPERKIIMTLNGDMVRSKTEALIADMLYHADISYRYEAPVYLSGYYTCNPDFTIRRKSDGKIFYWEHFGLLDDPDYLDNTINKLNKYAAADITVGDNLLITWETAAHPFDRKTASNYIRLLSV